jgi:hypothetical protein
MTELVITGVSDTEDAYTRDGTASTNYNNTNLLVGKFGTGGGTTFTAAIKFDISGIPAGATIDDAQLELYMNAEESGTARTCYVDRFTSYEFVETQVTYNNAYTGQAWSTNIRDAANVGAEDSSLSLAGLGWKTFTGLATAIQDWLDNPGTNFGWRLEAGTANTSRKKFDSSDSGANIPILRINYTAASGFIPKVMVF